MRLAEVDRLRAPCPEHALSNTTIKDGTAPGCRTQPHPKPDGIELINRTEQSEKSKRKDCLAV
jgi:hypothetical protein